MHKILRSSKRLILWLAPAALAHVQCQETWIATQTFGGFSTTSGGLTTTTWDPDGAGPQQPWIVVAGNAGVPGVTSDRVAAWDGTQWRAMGNGFGASVRVLHVHNGELYAGGDFLVTGGIQYVARWNGSTWVPLGTNAQNGANNSVYAMTTYGGNLVIGGYFTQVGGSTPASRVATWNGTTWGALGVGLNNGVEAIAVLGSDLIVGGPFTALGGGGGPALRVARWNGVTWSTLGDGFNAAVQSLHVHDGELYASGSFASSGVTPVQGIGRWTGSAWQQVGSGLNAAANTLGTYNGNLIAGGGFSASGGVPVARVAQFVSGAWSTLGAGVSGAVNDFVVGPNNELTIVGTFGEAGGLEVGGLARYNGLTYVGYGNALSNGVNALTLFNGELIAGGRFRSNGSVALNRIARLSNSQWQPMGAGFNRTVNALTVFNNQLWAGGDFFVGDGGSTSNYAAVWNGSSWQNTPGLSNSVNAFAVYNGTLYAGGAFTGFLAAWNGSTWVPLGVNNRPSSTVNGLVVFNNQLVVVGSFTSVASPGIANSAYVMGYNGSTWTSFGLSSANTNGTATAVHVHNGELYVSGNFSSIGGVAAGRIARWTGSGFAPLGGGLNGAAAALASYNSELVVAGGFTQADGTVGVSGIARWNGAQWRGLGSGLSGSNFGSLQGIALLPGADGVLRVGGSFTTAGGLPSAGVAVWTAGGGQINITQQPASQVVCPLQDFLLAVETSGSGTFTYQWRKDGLPLRDGRGIQGSTTAQLSINDAGPLDAGVYDVVVFNDCGPLLSSQATITYDANCAAVCNSIDFNNNGVFPEEQDVIDFFNVLAGGTCP